MKKTSSKSAKLGRNPFEKSAPHRVAASSEHAESTAEPGLPHPGPLLRALVAYFAAESALLGVRILDLATEMLSTKKRASA